jgi:hypothetical protein
MPATATIRKEINFRSRGQSRRDKAISNAEHRTQNIEVE